MFLADRANLNPDLRAGDPRIAGYSARAHVSLKGPDNVRRFFGLLAQSDADADEFVLAFRGTRSAADYLTNGLFGLSRFPAGGPRSGRVHRGWRNLYSSARVAGAPEAHSGRPSFARELNAAIAKAQARARGDGKADAEAVKLTVAAHSLGSAIATLFVVENASLEGSVRPASVCTLASPMVGDAAFVAGFDGLRLNSWRVVIDKDTVPRLPGRRWGYRHVGREAVLASRTAASPRRMHDIGTYLSLLSGS